MAKTHSDKSEERLEKLQLRLIEVEAQIKNPIPDDPFHFMTIGLRKLEHERDVINAMPSHNKCNHDIQFIWKGFARAQTRPIQQNSFNPAVNCRKRGRRDRVVAKSLAAMPKH